PPGAAGVEPVREPVVAASPAEAAVGAVAGAAPAPRAPPSGDLPSGDLTSADLLPGDLPPGDLPPGDLSTAAQRTGGLVVRPPPVPTAPHTRPLWREPPAHEFVGVPCGGCHSAQERWWRGHPHSRAAARLRSRRGRVLEIAQAYGVAEDELDRGTATCMWCHGTITARPGRRVRAGVGCQRCHGAGADYLEAHQAASYPQSVALGLADLRDPAVQAATCAGCHYITDPALIDAGHPTGAGFDNVSRKAGIVHWGEAFDRPHAPVGTEALRAAHARVLAARGPIPERTTPVSPPELGPGRAGLAPGANEAAGPGGDAVMAGLTVRPAEPERPDPPGSRGPAAGGSARGDGDREASTTIDVVRQHLEALARALGLSDP
ncbi:MAG: multiheme c-type cytochrome, partial [Acidobacteria bacterium]|nr:multiheme c-type cytochrome [Acidobacteriota bacterium]